MRKGFTTGSCAAAAAKAAAYMLFTHVKKENIKILTPAGIEYAPHIEKIKMGGDGVSCGVIKDAGDDPDVTDGLLICARVSLDRNLSGQEIKITGGRGVGLVTQKGLEVSVGNPAINAVPRSMIEKEVGEVLALFDAECGINVEIFVPEGEKIAKNTFNPRMGIEGGISILGTTGIVEPMSSAALIKTIELDIRMKKAAGETRLILVPGNYGENFLKNTYGIDPGRTVIFSNYMGQAIDLAVAEGFRQILVVGHTGKLVKVSGGIMNTHSREADARLELMLAAAVTAADRSGKSLSLEFCAEILNQMTTTGALDLLQEAGLLEETSRVLLEKILYHLRKRAGEGIEIACMIYENSYGLLAQSEGAENFL